MDTKNPQSSYVYEGTTINLEWIRTDQKDTFLPITQVYGICFNNKGEILICRSVNTGKWQIPGGKPEGVESIEETLIRELDEEVTITVKNIRILGVQKVTYPNNPNTVEGDIFYQARMICDLDELSPSRPDPDNGKTWERDFVPSANVHEFVPWGDLGKAMFQDATDLWKQLHR